LLPAAIEEVPLPSRFLLLWEVTSIESAHVSGDRQSNDLWPEEGCGSLSTRAWQIIG
jgi:hypothetical protein